LTDPASVSDVRSVLRGLGARKRYNIVLLESEGIQVVAKRQFTGPFMHVQDGEEIASVPIAPATPNLI
jgi:hypothetical protein